MRRFIFTAAAILAIFGCQKPEGSKVAPGNEDKISVTPENGTVEAAGGVVQVIVSSSSEWELKGKGDYSSWVTPSAVSGKDGDIVEFKVQPNATQDKLVSEWTFTCGKAIGTYILTSLPADVVPDHLNLISEAKSVLGYEAGAVEIVTESSIHYRQLEVKLSDGAEQWLTYKATLEGENEGEAKFVFDYATLEDLDDRNATVTISAEGVNPVSVELIQEAKHILAASNEFYTAKLEGETIAVPMTANVAYSIAIEDGKTWISHKEKKDGCEYFEVAASENGEKRSAKITFTQTDAKDGETPLSAVITVTQQTTLINWAVRMNGNRLFPKWEDGYGKLGAVRYFTLEFLIRPESFKKTGSIMTVMGIEDNFLLRFGDVGNSPNRIQVATSKGNWNITEELVANRWTHVAVVFNSGIITAYFNGKDVGSYEYETGSSWGSYIKLAPEWSYDESWGQRCFWIGYSNSADRDFLGLMTEFRIWTKALTEEEINAENHFYSVDSASEGLFCYWKVAKNEGDTIANAANDGKNPLYGETNVRKQDNDQYIGDAGIVFEKVSLPEE